MRGLFRRPLPEAIPIAFPMPFAAHDARVRPVRSVASWVQANTIQRRRIRVLAILTAIVIVLATLWNMAP